MFITKQGLCGTLRRLMKSSPDHRREELPDAGSLTSVLEQVLARARAAGATQAESSIGASRALSVGVRKGEVETLEFHADHDLDVTVFFGQRRGHASTGDFSAAAIAETVDAACAIARHTGEDVWAGLAPPDRMANSFPELDVYHPWPLTPEQAIALARECEAAGMDADKRISNSEGASADTSASISVYANSHGFTGVARGTRHSMGCVLIAGQGEGMQRDYWSSSARIQSELDTPGAIGAEAARRTCARLDPRPLATGSYPVLFVPETARGLFGAYLGAVSGGALYRKASFLPDSAGQRVFSPVVQLRQRPHLSRAAGSANFDGDGVATADRELVVDGVVQGYLLDAYSARRLGLETTGNAGGVFNLVVQPGLDDYPALVRRMHKGLIVTELMGSGVNGMTGDYSRGAAGFWVENGAIAHPVQGITVAGNLKDMYRSIVALGSDVDARRNIRSPSVLIERMTVAGE